MFKRDRLIVHAATVSRSMKILQVLSRPVGGPVPRRCSSLAKNVISEFAGRLIASGKIAVAPPTQRVLLGSPTMFEAVLTPARLAII
jgi:hypothetical protein